MTATDATAPPTSPHPNRTFLEVARTPKMLVLLLVFLIIAVGCAGLGRWQLNRAFERAQLAADQQHREVEAGGPVALGEVLAPQQKFPGELIGRTIVVTGTFEPEQFYVRDRVVDDQLGYAVLSGLRVSDDGLGGTSWADLSGAPVLPVVRGWVADLSDLDLMVDRAPAGTVKIHAYLQGPEPAGPAPDAHGRMSSIAAAQLVNYWGGPIYSAYAVLADSDPAPSVELTLLPRPQIDGGGPGMNIRNLFYALEWWIFGGFAVALWVRMVRDESRITVDPFEIADIGEPR